MLITGGFLPTNLAHGQNLFSLLHKARMSDLPVTDYRTVTV